MMLSAISIFVVLAVAAGCVLFLLTIYWVVYRIYLAIEGNVLAESELWKKIPGAVRRPKFWQFALVMYWLTGRTTR
jgi:hypothetical protein